MSDRPGKKAGKTIRPEKAITAGVMDQLLPRLTKAATQCDGDLTIDCSRVKCIDAVGTAVLLQARQACREAGGGVALTHVNDELATLLQTMGLDRYLDIRPKKAGV